MLLNLMIKIYEYEIELGAETNDFVGNFGFDIKIGFIWGIVTGDVSKWL